MEEPYEPTPIHYDEGGFLEYLTRDVPFVVRRIDNRFSVLLDMGTREVIGYRFADHPSS